MKRTTNYSSYILRYVGASILFLAVFGIFITIIFSLSRNVQAQTTPDWAFLNTMGLPWRCLDEDGRAISDDWNDHWDMPWRSIGAAVDFNAPGDADLGLEVIAPFAGTVSSATQEGIGLGNYVRIDAADNDWSVILAHLDSFSNNINDGRVDKGEVVGTSGETGLDPNNPLSGPHIHLDLLWDGGEPDRNWFNTSGHFLFSHPTEDLLSSSETEIYSNNCGQGPATTLFWDGYWGGYSTIYFGYGAFRVPEWFDNQASSLLMNESQSVVSLYEHPDQQGGYITHYQDQGDFTADQYSNDVGVNDNTSSLLVVGLCPAGRVARTGAENVTQGCIDPTPIPPPQPTPPPEVPTPTPQPPPPQGWQVTYFSNNDLTSECGSRWEDSGTYVFRDSGPDPAHWQPPSDCPNSSDEWSARFERDYDFNGNYEFGLFYDDGARLWIDGDLVIDGFTPSTQHYESRELHGTHRIIIEYYNNAGHAVLQAWWRGPGYLPFDPNPDPNQWFVNYWGNQRMWQDAVGKRNEGTGIIDHSQWGETGPDFGIPTEHYSVKLERTIYFECGTYRFFLNHDDGARLYVDDQLIPAFDHWADGWRPNNADLFLDEGNHDLKIEYYQNAGGAGLYFDYREQLSGCSPDLTPDFVSGTSDAVIISSSPGTHSNDTLTASQPAYVDLAYQNADRGRAGAHFVDLYIDGALYRREWVSTLTGNATKTFDDLEIVYNTPGIHVVRLVLDPEDVISESNEQNNIWEWAFYWQPDPVLITDWRGEYYDNETLSGTPTIVRNDVDIDFDWFSASPDPAINADHFSARWTRTLPFEAGEYRFHVFHDDGARLWIDDNLVIDQWRRVREWHSSDPVPLSAGDHTVRLEMFEIDGWAAAKLQWERQGVSGCSVIPTGQFCAEYFNNFFLSGSPVFTRTEDGIDYDWGGDGPGGGVENDEFSARWTGNFDFDAGDYVLRALSDDGIRVWVDDQLLIDAWQDQHPTEFQTIFNPGVGQHEVKVEYYERYGGAVAQVSWEPYFLSTVQFSASTFNVNENGGNATIEATLSNPVDQIVLVDYATSDGTATTGSDYFTASDTLIFLPGQTSRTFNVSIINDVLNEPDETINLTLSNPVSITLGTPTSAVLTIIDDDVCSTPGTSSLVSPGNGTTTNDNTPTFDWNPTSDANEYQLQIDNNPDFSSPLIDIITSSSIYTPISALSDDTYYWRVRGYNSSNGCNVYGGWSNLWSVIINTPLPTVETLNFVVSFEYRDNAAGMLQNVPIKVKIKDASGNQVLFETADWVSVTPASGSDNWGTASIDVSTAGLTSGLTYQVFVKGAMHLAKRVTIPLTEGLTIDYTDPVLNSDGFLWACDIDQDNQVSNADVDLIFSLLAGGGDSPPPVPDPSSLAYRSDLNGDGFINIRDLTICTTNFLLGKVGDGAPMTAFSATPLVGSVPLTVTFTDQSSGTVTSWQWSFGDGYTSTQQHPQHIYAAPGLFTVTLTSTNDDGSHTLVKSNYITVASSFPIWSSSINLSNSVGASENPDVAISSMGDIHVVWNDNTAGTHDIFYTVKTAGGNWSVPVNISNQIGDAKYPSIVVDDLGVIHLVWGRNGIYYTQKPSGGNWTMPEIVSVGVKPKLAVGSDASIHIVWENGGEIYYVIKPDGGSWSTPVNLSNSSTNSLDPDIALDSQNRSHIVWDEEISGYSDIFYAAQLSDGSWSSPENVSNTTITSHFAKIVLDSTDKVHVFWPNNDAGGISKVMYSSKSASGSWSAPVVLFDTYVGYHPTPAVGVGDVLRIAWTSWSDTFYSKQLSDAWLPPLNVSDNPTFGWVTNLDSKAGIDALVWMDEEPGNQDIYYSEAADDAFWFEATSMNNLQVVPLTIPTPTPSPAK